MYRSSLEAHFAVEELSTEFEGYVSARNIANTQSMIRDLRSNEGPIRRALHKMIKNAQGKFPNSVNDIIFIYEQCNKVEYKDDFINLFVQ